MHKPTRLLSVALLCATASAQFTHVLPNGTATTEGNSSNAFPWGRGAAASLQIQTIYDSSNFTAASINFPIRITRLRYRLNGGVANTTPAVYTQVTVDMASALTDAMTPSTTFAANMGPDQAQVYSGPLAINAVAANTPGDFAWVDIPLTIPFVYDPTTNNDLVIFCDIPPNVGTGVPALQLDVQTTNSLSSRVYNSTTYGTGTGTIGTSHGVVVELTYSPTQGLYAGFSASATSGASPLQVQFTDRSFSSDAGGITSWAWDFDNDGVVDSTVQNPTHTYTSCGDYSVRLTVTDASHPASTETKLNYISVDSVNPSFTYSLLTVPNVYQFTDTTTPAAQSWAWDFDNDGVVDSTAQNPVWVAPSACGATTVRLTATNLCRTATVTEPIFLSPNGPFIGPVAGGNGTSSSAWVGNQFDMSVTAPEGITVCGLKVAPYTFTGAFDLRVYVKQDTFVGAEDDITQWRLVGTGQGTSLGGSSTNPTTVDVSVSPFYLPSGNYGMAVFIDNPAGTANIAYTNGPAASPYVGTDITLHPNGLGTGRTGLFSGTNNNPRLWNGGFYYGKSTTTFEAAYGTFATGCPGSLGVSTLTATALPHLGGTLHVDVDNVPSAAFMLLGLSKTNSRYGALPLDGTPYGAPGCFLRVSDDASALLLSSSNAATWNFGIPNNPSLLNARFHNQAAVLDLSVNAFGFVFSDAAGAVIGN